MNQAYQSILASGAEKKILMLEEEIQKDIVRRIQKAGKITSTADWQIQRYMVLGHSTEDVETIIRQTLGGDWADTFRLYDEVVEQEYVRSRAIYEQVNAHFIPYEQNYELQQITNALIQQSNDELFNITKSLGFMVDMGNGRKVFAPLSEIYNGYLDNAITMMASGAFDYNTMIRKVVGEMTASGLRTVDYPTWHSNRVDVAVRRALLTGMGQLTGHISDINAQNLGTDKFEVDWHMGARPEHAAWQGRVWTHRELVEICGLGTGPGLLGWNCRHTYYPFIEGISVRNYSDEWLEAMDQKEAEKISYRGREYNTYEATQKQRQMETAMRAQREKAQLLQQGKADPNDILNARCKYQAMLDEYKEFSRKFHLPEQRERIYADLRGRVAPSQRTYKRWQAEQADKIAKRIAKNERKADRAMRERAEKNRRNDLDSAKNAMTEKRGSGIIKETFASKFKAADSISNVVKYAKQTLGIDLIDFEKVNIDTGNMMNLEVSKLFDVFGNLSKSGDLKGIRVYPKRASWYAAYSPGWREVFVRNLKSKDILNKLEKDAVNNFKCGFWSTPNTEHFIRHELGHAIQHMATDHNKWKRARIEEMRKSIVDSIGITNWSMTDTPEHIKMAGRYLSYYGLKDTGEFIAESVAEYMGGNARETARKVVEILLKEGG